MRIFTRQPKGPTAHHMLDQLPPDMPDGYLTWRRGHDLPTLHALGQLDLTSGLVGLLSQLHDEGGPQPTAVGLQTELALPILDYTDISDSLALPEGTIVQVGAEEYVVAKLRVVLDVNGDNLHYLWPISDNQIPESLSDHFGTRRPHKGLALTCLKLLQDYGGR